MSADDRIPVIVGVGQVNDRPADPSFGLDSAGLMRAAEADAGGGWLAGIDSLALVDQISFAQLGDFSRDLARRIGANPRFCSITEAPNGDSPIRLLNEAANRIGAGEAVTAAVVGGEALRTAAQRAALRGADVEASNAARARSAQRAPDLRQRYGLVAPVDLYPLYENAGRAAYGQSLAEAQAESAEIWSRFSRVAAANESAWIRRPITPEALLTVTADNRPIAFPYTKFMVANSSVNQGAGFIVTSLAEARARGVPEEKIVYVGLGAAAHEPEDPLGRDRYDRSASMAVSIRRTLDLNEVGVEDLDHVELYSCFPCVPKMARRVLGWPIERPATVFGGLTFGGGPIGNYMSHAVAEMVRALRRGGRLGLLFGNGGIATHNHSIVLGKAPIAAAKFPRGFDFQAEADAAHRAVTPLAASYAGPARIETYTVFHERSGAPKFGVIVALTPDGRRTLAKVAASDAATIAFLKDGAVQPVGSLGEIVPDACGDQVWRRRRPGA
jgi:acetyl-CoA C-acetyltransferase